jgi:hypothetical protein
MRKGSASSMPTRTSTTRMARAPDMPIAAQRSHEGKYAPNKGSDGAHPPTPSIRGAGAARMRKERALGTTHARIAIDRMPLMDPFAHLAASAVGRLLLPRSGQASGPAWSALLMSRAIPSRSVVLARLSSVGRKTWRLCAPSLGHLASRRSSPAGLGIAVPINA